MRSPGVRQLSRIGGPLTITQHPKTSSGCPTRLRVATVQHTAYRRAPRDVFGFPTGPNTLMNFLLKIPAPCDPPNNDSLKIPPPLSQEPDLDADQIAEGLAMLARRGVKLSGKKSRGIRGQYFMQPREAARFKIITLAMHVILGRPVAQALVLRVALLRLARDAAAALKDKSAAEALRDDVTTVRDAAG